MPVIENWRLRRRFPECKFIFPNAPNIPITVVRFEKSLEMDAIDSR